MQGKNHDLRIKKNLHVNTYALSSWVNKFVQNEQIVPTKTATPFRESNTNVTGRKQFQCVTLKRVKLLLNYTSGTVLNWSAVDAYRYHTIFVQLYCTYSL